MKLIESWVEHRVLTHTLLEQVQLRIGTKAPNPNRTDDFFLKKNV
jgi:hypothetical protein